MRNIAIFDSPKGRLMKIAESRMDAEKIRLHAFAPGEQYDAVIISTVAPLLSEPVRCETIVLPGESGQAISAKQAISYGLTSRDSLTVSSINAGSIALALQRDIMSLGGENILRQEFIFKWRLSALNALPVAAINILCGENYS